MINYRLKSSGINPTRKRVAVYSEQALQIQCVRWFSLQYPKFSNYLFHIPNGGSRSHKTNKYGKSFSPEAMRFKLMGVKSGVSDLFLAYPNIDSHGLWIEMKSDKGRLTKNQIDFMKRMESVGYKTTSCNSLELFMTTVREYLKGLDS